MRYKINRCKIKKEYFKIYKLTHVLKQAEWVHLCKEVKWLVSVWVVVCGVKTEFSDDGNRVVLNHDVSAFLFSQAIPLLMMTTEAVPLANLTVALDLCVDPAPPEEPSGMVKAAEKDQWTCLGASWSKYGGNDGSWRQKGSGWKACTHRNLSGPDGTGRCGGPVLLCGSWVEGSAEETR